MLRAVHLFVNLAAAALLQPSVWGYWYLLNLIVAYGPLSQLGVLNGMNREVPSALGTQDENSAILLRRNTLGFLLLATSCTIILLVAVAAILPDITLSIEALLTLGLLLASQLYGYAVTSLRSTMQFQQLARIQWTEVILFPVLAIGGAWLFGLTGFIAGQAIALLLCFVLSSRIQTIVLKPLFDWGIIRTLISIGLPIMLVGLLYVLLTTIDRWIVNAYLGPESLGHYSMAILTFTAVGFLPSLIAQLFYPRMARSWSAEHNVPALKDLAARQRTLAFIVVVPIVLAFTAMVPWGIRTFLPQYAPAIPAMLVAAIGPLFAVFGQGFGEILNILNRQYWYMAALLIAVLVNAGVSVLLVHEFGIVGVACGSVAAFLVLGILRIVLGHVAMRIAPK